MDNKKPAQEFLTELICHRFTGAERDAWLEWLARVAAGDVRAKPPIRKDSKDDGVNMTFLHHWPGCAGARGPRRDN